MLPPVITHSDSDQTGVSTIRKIFLPLSSCLSLFLSLTRTYKTGPHSNQRATRRLGPPRHNTKILKTQRVTRKTAINLDDCLLTERTLLIQDSTSQEQHCQAVSCRDSSQNSCEHLLQTHTDHLRMYVCYHANRQRKKSRLIQDFPHSNRQKLAEINCFIFFHLGKSCNISVQQVASIAECCMPL